MFEKFSSRARRAVVFAQEEARLLNHRYIGTEHLLLGLLREDEGVAARALHQLGVALAEARRRVEEVIGTGLSSPAGHMPFTPRAKRVLELALRERGQSGDRHIGTGHLLVGIVREGRGVGARVLAGFGCDAERVAAQVRRVVDAGEAQEREPGEDEEGFVVSLNLLGRVRMLEETVKGLEERVNQLEGRLEGQQAEQAGPGEHRQ